MVQLVRDARSDGEEVLVRWLDRLPLPLLMVAPGLVLLAVAAIVPDGIREGYSVDLEIYRRYGVQLLAGLTPYREVPIEYPPLALLPILVPFVGGPGPAAVDLGTYTWRFVAVAAALAVAAAWLLWRFGGGSRIAVALWTTLVAASWVAAVYRYDLWPAVATLAGVLLASRRPGLAGLAIGAGTMLKLFPVVVYPVLAAAAVLRRDWFGLVRLTVGLALVVGVAGGWAWAIAGPASLDWLRYQEDRGLQLESVGASLLLGAHVIAGLPVGSDFGFGSVQVVAPGSTELVRISPWLQVALLGAVVLLAVRRFRRDQRRLGTVAPGSVALGALAAIAATLVGSKVLSMQYALWLLPLVPLVGVRIRWLAIPLAVLTTAVFTLDYEGLWHFEPAMIALLLARNVVLVVFLAVLVSELWSGEGARPEALVSAGTDQRHRGQHYS